MFKFLLQILQNFTLIFSRKKDAPVELPKPEDEPEVVTPPKPEEKIYDIDDSWLIPTGIPGHAVTSSGWTYTDGKPTSVTWHWTATWDRELCDKLLGGDNALRKPKWNEEEQKWEGGASAHFCVGRSEEEGISQYVKLEHRSWHAGGGQTVRWDGKNVFANGTFLSGSRTSIGIETVEVGFARPEAPKEDDWIEVYGTDGKNHMWVQPWTEEQVDMMIFLGRKIIEKYPNIGYLDHHGHHDICPGYKSDPSLAFPFAKVLSGIYRREIPDVWSPFMAIKPRQRALELLGYDLGPWGADGDWGAVSDAALRKFQIDSGLHANGEWSTFVCWEVYFALLDAGYSLDDIYMEA